MTFVQHFLLVECFDFDQTFSSTYNICILITTLKHVLLTMLQRVPEASDCGAWRVQLPPGTFLTFTAKILSPIVINVPSRASLAVETKGLLFMWWEHLNNKNNVCKHIIIIFPIDLIG